MPELNEAEARELQEAHDRAVAAAETANAALAEARRETARLRATDQARPIATTQIGESDLPAVSAGRALNEALKTVPLTDENTLDEASFKTTVEEAIKAEQSFLARLDEANGAGKVRGHGSTGATGWTGTTRDTASIEEAKAAEADLTETYKRRGMSDEAAAYAAAGRY